MPIICFFKGHEWQNEVDFYHPQTGKLWTKYVERRCCQRCGKPNPEYREDDDDDDSDDDAPKPTPRTPIFAGLN